MGSDNWRRRDTFAARGSTNSHVHTWRLGQDSCTAVERFEAGFGTPVRSCATRWENRPVQLDVSPHRASIFGTDYLVKLTLEADEPPSVGLAGRGCTQ